MLNVNVIDSTLDRYTGGAQAEHLERRSKPRIEESFPATMHGVDSVGLPFAVDCVLDNLSCLGLYVRIRGPVPCGSEVQLLVRISTGASISLRGRILRDELQADGTHGLAIAIDHYDFV